MTKEKHFNAMLGSALLFILVSLISACTGPRSYSEVVSSYPAGTELCLTDVDVEDAGNGNLNVSGTVFLNGAFGAVPTEEDLRCFGTKAHAVGSVTLGGRTYEPGTLLTVNRNRRWVEVTSWD